MPSSFVIGGLINTIRKYYKIVSFSNKLLSDMKIRVNVAIHNYENLKKRTSAINQHIKDNCF